MKDKKNLKSIQCEFCEITESEGILCDQGILSNIICSDCYSEHCSNMADAIDQQKTEKYLYNYR